MSGQVSSMTGFARSAGEVSERRWVWEIKSVNNRGMELRFRLPPGFDFLEPSLRKALQKRLKRGSIFTSLSLESATSKTKIRLNQTALEEMLTMIDTISTRVDCQAPRPEGILSLRGVLEVDDEAGLEDAEALTEKFLQTYEEAIGKLLETRRQEGAAMAAAIEDQFTELQGLAHSAKNHPGASLDSIRARLDAQLKSLLESGSNSPEPERLAQEVALMALKADIREELDRLDAHIQSGRAILSRGGSVGRELDFLTQELNRETNTLCSKAQDIELKQIGLDLKKVIDQVREQVQNIE